MVVRLLAHVDVLVPNGCSWHWSSLELTVAAISIVEEDPEYMLDQINSELRLLLPNHAHICRSTLSTMLHGQLTVMKKLEDAPQQRYFIVVKNARSNFARWLMQQCVQHELIFIDEAGINVWAKRTRDWAVAWVHWLISCTECWYHHVRKCSSLFPPLATLFIWLHAFEWHNYVNCFVNSCVFAFDIPKSS